MKRKKPIKMSKKEAEAVTADGTAMGEALKKAGFDPETGDSKFEMLTTYSVSFVYEGINGKQYNQTSVVSDCRNAQDAQNTISEEIMKRGLDPEKVEFLETTERPDLNQEVVVEAQMDIPGTKKPKTKPTPAPNHRMVNFNCKIADVNVKQGDTRLLKIVMLVGDDIARVSSELLEKFKSDEFLCITVEPLQLTLKDVAPQQEKAKDKTKDDEQPKTEEQKKEEVKSYTCPFCSTQNEVNLKDKLDKVICDCGKEFPIGFSENEEENPKSSENQKENKKSDDAYDLLS